MIELKYMNKSIYKRQENAENSFSETNTQVLVAEMSNILDFL